MPSAYRVVFGIFVFLALLAFLPSSVHAQAGLTLGQPITIDNYKAPQNTNYSVLNLEHTIGCEGVGVSMFPQDCLAYSPTNGVLQAYKVTPTGGAVGSLTTGMLAMYENPPTSTTQYLAYVGSNVGLVPKTYAQVSGSGSDVISPVIQLWQLTRNIAYLGFILIFIIIGFMIMFRQRMNPQTVVTVQSALPSLVIGLILVTFSYFVAALLVDLSFVFVSFLTTLFSSVGNNALGTPDQLQQISKQNNIFQLFITFALNGNTLGSIGGQIKDSITGIYPTPNITSGEFVGQLMGKAGGWLIGSFVGGLIDVILIIACIFQMVRLFWGLLMSYISILINTVMAPLIILYGTIPGRQGVLSFWWKNILGNALVFPAVFAAFLFAGALIGAPQGAFGESMPFFTFPQGLIRGLLAFGVVLSTPSIPKMIREAVGVKGFGEMLGAASAGFASGAAPFQAAAGLGYNEAISPLQRTRQSMQRIAQDNAYNRVTGEAVSKKGPSIGFWEKAAANTLGRGGR
jgi:hypothetical protein